MVLTMLTFAALLEKSRFFYESDTGAILIYFFIAIVAAVLLMIANTSSILRILQEMNRFAKGISTGGEARFRVLSLDSEFAAIEYGLIEMGGEIEEHRRNMEMKVERRTMELQSALADLKEKDDMIQKQLDIAGTIQRGILPGRVDDWNELKFSVRYIAMEKIGGDFYDVFQLKDGKLGFLSPTCRGIAFRRACDNHGEGSVR